MEAMSVRNVSHHVAVVAPDEETRDRFVRLISSAGLASQASQESRLTVLVADTDDLAVKVVSGLKKRWPSRRLVLVVNPSTTGRALRASLRAEVDAIVYADQAETALVPTIRAVFAGQVVFPGRGRRRFEIPALSRRERQVLRLAVEGCTNREIGERLFLGTSTVKSHLTSAFAKLAVRSRSEAAALLADPDYPAGRLILDAAVNDGPTFDLAPVNSLS